MGGPAPRKNYLFVGSEAGGKAAAIAYTLIETAKLNAVDPNAWLADTLARIPDYKITKVDNLLPWRWNRGRSGPDGYLLAAPGISSDAVRAPA
ncbi:transposase domain-containing protein [Paracoccus sp. SJTW-4]